MGPFRTPVGTLDLDQKGDGSLCEQAAWGDSLLLSRTSLELHLGGEHRIERLQSIANITRSAII